MKRVALTVAMAVFPIASLAGQTLAADTSIFHPGQRVRVHTSALVKGRIVGRVVRATTDTVVVDTFDLAATRRLFGPSTVLVDDARQIAVPVGDVSSVEVSRGRSRFLGILSRGAKGAFIGGAVMGLVSISGQANPHSDQFMQGLRTGLRLGTIVGVGFGFSRGEERWVKPAGGMSRTK